MADNFLVYSVYFITGYHAIFIYSGALIRYVQICKKKKEDRALEKKKAKK